MERRLSPGVRFFSVLSYNGTMSFDPKALKSYPTRPGVYLMKDAKGTVIYVGKAKDLRARLRQYFLPSGDGRAMIPQLIAQVEDIETIVLRTEKEALLLENTLIKKHQPKYNVLLKDDKTYISLKISKKHPWPLIQLVRYKGKPKPDGWYFGPYTSVYHAKRTLELLNRLFPLRQCSDQEFARRDRPCLLYQMGRCVAPCVDKCSKEDYDSHVQRTIKFLRGQDQEVLEELYAEMHKASEELEFERAGQLLKTIRAIEGTLETQKVVKVGNRDFDAIGLYRQGDELTITQMRYQGGRLVGARHESFSGILQDDAAVLESYLVQRYQDADSIPHEILLPIPLSDASLLSELLSEGKARSVKVYSPQRGEKRSIVKMAQTNAETSFTKEKDEASLSEKRLLELQRKLRLSNYPRRIECFDTSNIQGSSPVAAMVVFKDAKPDKSEYRRYIVKTGDKPDDYAAMYEVLTRRYKRAKENKQFPDLLIVDGGKGQLNVALRVLKELDVVGIDVIGLAKEASRHDKGTSQEQVFLPGAKDPIMLGRHSALLFLLQNIRDESHRFAIDLHRKRRKKSTIKSALDGIPGIGPAKRKALLSHFGSVKKIKEASDDALLRLKGISKANVAALRQHL